MAELLSADGWTIPGSLGAYLRDVLPDDYVVVADPVVRRHPLDAVVVGPRGLTALGVVGEHGAGEVEGPGDAQSPAAGAESIEHDGRRAASALRGFLHDEFPALQPKIRYLAVRCRTNGDAPGWDVLEPEIMSVQSLEDAITAAEEWPADEVLGDESAREALGAALRDRQLTATMRAGHPFVFRSGSALGGGTQVWTIRDAVAHMDRHPDDGIYHLRNGTLAQWLADEGAGHLANLARAVVRQTNTDRRIALEMFLLGSGLVKRTQLAIRPKQVDLGYILAGDTGVARLKIGKGRGRGYLFGSLEPGDPWLHVEPRTFAGGPAEFVASADTDLLPIGREAQATEIFVDSSAAEEPVAVPVRLHVVAMPSPFQRWIVRPVCGLVIAGLLGALVGWLLGTMGAEAPVPGVAALAGGPTVFWMIAIGALWAVCGALSGALQPPAWPIRHAAGRWLVRVAAWSGELAVLAAAATIYLQVVYEGRPLAEATAIGPVVLGAIAAGVLPGTIRYIQSARSARTPAQLVALQPVRRPVAGFALGALVLIVLLVSPLLRPTFEDLRQRGTLTSMQEWSSSAWTTMNNAADNLMTRLYLRYYDRRIPSASSPTPTITPPGAEGAGMQP